MRISPLKNISPLSRNTIPTGTAPQFTANPVITAPSFEVGQTLTCSDGTVTGTAPITYSYQWHRGVTNIGTDSATYVAVYADIAENITCTVTATNAYGNASQVSNTVVILITLQAVFNNHSGRNQWAAENSTVVGTTTTWIDYAGVHNIANPSAASQFATNDPDTDFNNKKTGSFLTDDYAIKNTANYGAGQTTGSMFFVFKTGGTIKQSSLFASSDTATDTNFFYCYLNSTFQFQFQTSIAGVGFAKRTDTALAINTKYIVQVEQTGSVINIFVNDTLWASTVVLGIELGQWLPSVVGKDNITIGVLTRTANAAFYDGKIVLVGNYPLLTAGNRSDVFNKLNSYYAVY